MLTVKNTYGNRNRPEIVSYQKILAETNPAPWKFPLHKHDYPELSLVTNGEGTLHWQHQNYSLKKGILVIKDPDTLHGEITSAQWPIHQFCLGLTGIDIPGLSANHLLPSGCPPVFDTGMAFDYLNQTFRFLFALYQQKENTQALKETQTQVLMAMIAAIHLLTDTQSQPATANIPYSSLVRQTLAYVDQHYKEALTLDNVAQALLVSSSTLSHHFKEETGQPLKQYILERKLGEAERLLAFESKEIRTIASECGYGSLQYFYNIFKKSTGYTPAEFRAIYRNIL